MIFRRFFAIFVAILLCSALFCGNFSSFVFADVVHAYRKPSEADLQWLRGNESALSPDLPGIVQVGFTTPSNNISNNMLIPRLCSPVSVPIPMPSPPSPQTGDTWMNAGLVPEGDGVVNIAPIAIDSETSIVQVAGERLPPPSEVPTEQSFTVPMADFIADPPPMPSDQEQFWAFFNQSNPDRSNADFGFGCGDFDDDHSTCVCFTCITCGDHRRNKPRSCTPDMLGSSAWLTGHYVGTAGTTPIGTTSTQFALPTMLLSRPNVAERFNADVRNRIWADYQSWNNAVAIDRDGTLENRAVEQFSFGLEKQVLQKNSVELRVPVIYQFRSNQRQFGSNQRADASVEIGNVSVFLKQALRQGCRWTVSGGVGVSLPTAEDWRSPVDTARLKNNAYYLVSFLGVQWHPNKSTFGHFLVQTDLPIAKNELVFGTERKKVSGQQMIRTGIQLGRWIYRVDHSKRPCRLGLFTEINYAVVTNGSSERKIFNGEGDAIYVNAFNSRRSTLTAAVGVPMVFGRLTCTNAIILPISGSDRPFSVGYSFSLSRQF